MTKTSGDDGSLLTRGAVAIGRTFGEWQQRRITAAQDAYVESWQAAWTEGCSAAWSDVPLSAVPYQRTPKHDAWVAGWHWAQTRPDRRDPAREDANSPAAARWRNGERRRHLVSAAKGGAVSLTVFAAARWIARLRGRGHASEPIGDQR
jgi:hypothetical protein